jgi:hypothetical protein
MVLPCPHRSLNEADISASADSRKDSLDFGDLERENANANPNFTGMMGQSCAVNLGCAYITLAANASKGLGLS